MKKTNEFKLSANTQGNDTIRIAGLSDNFFFYLTNSISVSVLIFLIAIYSNRLTHSAHSSTTFRIAARYREVYQIDYK